MHGFMHRYKQLVSKADREAQEAADAAKVAKRYGGQYQKELAEAELHGDKHAALWREAQE